LIISYHFGNVNHFITDLVIFLLIYYHYGKIFKSGDLMRSVLPKRLKAFREQNGWTQQKLGEMLSVSDATINRYEKGLRSPDPEMLEKFADVFNVSVDYLLGRVDDPKKLRIPDTANNNSTGSQKNTDLPEVAMKEIEDFTEFVKKKYQGENQK
jgi:transcriptional regulator with XRE-family HTH domain